MERHRDEQGIHFSWENAPCDVVVSDIILVASIPNTNYIILVYNIKYDIISCVLL